MKIKLEDLLTLIPENEEVKLIDVCDGEDVYIGRSRNVPSGLRKWMVEGVAGAEECGLMLYGAHPFMQK